MVHRDSPPWVLSFHSHPRTCHRAVTVASSSQGSSPHKRHAVQYSCSYCHHCTKQFLPRSITSPSLFCEDTDMPELNVHKYMTFHYSAWSLYRWGLLHIFPKSNAFSSISASFCSSVQLTEMLDSLLPAVLS